MQENGYAIAQQLTLKLAQKLLLCKARREVKSKTFVVGDCLLAFWRVMVQTATVS